MTMDTDDMKFKELYISAIKAYPNPYSKQGFSKDFLITRSMTQLNFNPRCLIAWHQMKSHCKSYGANGIAADVRIHT